MSTSDYTILIPTYRRRSPLLHNLLKFLDSFGENYNIIVGDSGHPENKKLTSEFIKTLQNVNVIHKDYPPALQFSEKISDMTYSSKTPYSVVCADDDFIIPGTINMACQFLEENPTYSVCQGKHFQFEFGANFDNLHEIWTTMWVENPLLERVAQEIRYYLPLVYGVTKTDYIRTVYGIAAKHGKLFEEFVISPLLAMYGNVKVIDSLYYLRQDNPPTIAIEKVYREHRRFYERELEKIMVEFEDFMLHLDPGLNRDIIRGKLEAAHCRRVLFGNTMDNYPTYYLGCDEIQIINKIRENYLIKDRDECERIYNLL